MTKSHISDCCGGMAAPMPGKKYADNKHILVLVDNNEAHRKQVQDALMSFYNIVMFDDAEDALVYMRKTRPIIGIAVICEDVPPRGGFALLHDLRAERKLETLPAIMILSSENEELVAAVKESTANGWLAKPYRRSALIKLISGQLNKTVEQQWEELPELQAQALKGTVEMFNSLSDIIEKGEPIHYTDVNAACAPLVEAVNSGDYKGILSGVKFHDNYTYAHSLRVAVFLSLFGQAIDLSKKDQKLLATGGLLHDVGKMFIPHLVLNKPGKLTSEEFEVMKEHVPASVRVLEASEGIPKGVIIIAGQHHEKLNGLGYPKGLKGDELNELARMAAIVDVFSALTDRRVYKPPIPPEKALAIMADEMTGHLDVALLARFRQMLLDAAIDT